MNREEVKVILDLIDNELEYAIEKYGLYNSHSEAYAVILEEVQEAEEEIIYVQDLLEDYWECIRANEYDEIEELKLEIFKGCIKGIQELIQVAAMVKKEIHPRK